MGRGGAGNFVAPTDGERNSALEGIVRTKELVKGKLNIGDGRKATDTTGGKAPAYRGRGGAGNWAGEQERVVERGEDKEQADETRKLEVEERVRREVEDGLRQPPRAYSGLGAGKEDQVDGLRN